MSVPICIILCNKFRVCQYFGCYILGWICGCGFAASRIVCEHSNKFMLDSLFKHKGLVDWWVISRLKPEGRILDCFLYGCSVLVCGVHATTWNATSHQEISLMVDCREDFRNSSCTKFISKLILSSLPADLLCCFAICLKMKLSGQGVCVFS